jgi:ABC-type oligopeptide transport system ATPase subunit
VGKSFLRGSRYTASTAMPFANTAPRCRLSSETRGPRMTVGRTIAEALIATNWGSRPMIAERVRELLGHVGLRQDQATQYPHELSGGQRQRIAVAGALASQPKFIVLDEPVSALDVSIRAQMMNLLKAIQARENVAYLLVAHDLATVRHMVDQTAVMYLGEIVEYAPTRSLFAMCCMPTQRRHSPPFSCRVRTGGKKRSCWWARCLRP